MDYYSKEYLLKLIEQMDHIKIRQLCARALQLIYGGPDEDHEKKEKERLCPNE